MAYVGCEDLSRAIGENASEEVLLEILDTIPDVKAVGRDLIACVVGIIERYRHMIRMILIAGAEVEEVNRSSGVFRMLVGTVALGIPIGNCVKTFIDYGMSMSSIMDGSEPPLPFTYAVVISHMDSGRILKIVLDANTNVLEKVFGNSALRMVIGKRTRDTFPANVVKMLIEADF